MKIINAKDELHSQKYEGLRVRFDYTYSSGDYCQDIEPFEDVFIVSVHFEHFEKDIHDLLAASVIRGLEAEISSYCHEESHEASHAHEQD